MMLKILFRFQESATISRLFQLLVCLTAKMTHDTSDSLSLSNYIHVS